MCSLILAWHVLSALPQGDLSGTVSAVFTHGRPGRVALAPGGLVLGPAAARKRYRHLACAASLRMGRHAGGGYTC